MPFIKAKNGNVVECDDALAERAVKQGHEAFADKALKKKWEEPTDESADSE